MMIKTTSSKRLFAIIVVCLAMLAGTLSLTACKDTYQPAVPTAIELDTTQVRTDYVKGEQLDLTRLTAIVVYGEGENAARKEVPISACVVTPAAGTVLAETDNKVTVSYTAGDKTVSQSFTIVVRNSITSVVEAEGSALINYKYNEGDTISPEGVKYYITYSDGSTATVDATAENTVVMPEQFTVGMTTVTVYYKEYANVRFEYAVEPKPTALEMDVSRVRNTYAAGMTLDLSGIVLKVVYGSGANAERQSISVDDCVVTPALDQKLAETDKKVTVSYTEGGISLSQTFDITVTNKIVGVVQAEDSALAVNKYQDGAKIKFDGIKYEVTYEDGTTQTVAATAANTKVTPAVYDVATTKQVTVQFDNGSYVGAAYKFAVTALPSYITANASDAKTDYIKDEELEITGLKAALLYGRDKANPVRSEEIAIGDCTIEPAVGTKLDLADTNITVRYETADVNLKCTYSITVHNDIVNIVQAEGSALENSVYFVNQTITPRGIKYLITRENGETETVAASILNSVVTPAVFHKDTEKIAVYYKDGETEYNEFTFEFDVEAAKGAYIEAEDGILPIGASLCTDGSDLDYAHKPSGDGYVGDIKADDSKNISMIFVFDSDIEGKGNVQLRMASQYLKETTKDANGKNTWTPTVMGDTELAKICKIYINDSETPIDLTGIILPGGEAADKTVGDANLWLNWQTVELPEIDIKAGRNELKVTFNEHDYKDCAQASSNGKFTANIDSLIVTSEQCEISAYELAFDKTSVTPVSVSLEQETADGKATPYFVITGTAYYTGYTEKEAAFIMTNALNRTVKSNNASQYTFGGYYFDFQGNLAAGASTRYTLTDARNVSFIAEPSDKEGAGENDYKGTFTIKVDVSSLGLADKLGKYSTHFDIGSANNVNFNFIGADDDENKYDTSMVQSEPLQIGYMRYTLVYEPEYDGSKGLEENKGNDNSALRQQHYYGTVGLLIEDLREVKDMTVSGVTLSQGTEDNAEKVYLNIAGTATVRYYSETDAAEAIAGKLAGISGATAIVKKAEDAQVDADGNYAVTFEIIVDVTSVEDNEYALTLDGKDIVLAAVDETYTIGLLVNRIRYALVAGEKDGVEGKVISFKKWNAYAVKVTASMETPVVTLENRDNKPYFVIGGGVYTYTYGEFDLSDPDEAKEVNDEILKQIKTMFLLRMQNNPDSGAFTGYDTVIQNGNHAVELSEDNKFAIVADISVLKAGGAYGVHFNYSADGTFSTANGANDFSSKQWANFTQLKLVEVEVNRLLYQAFYKDDDAKLSFGWDCVAVFVSDPYVPQHTVSNAVSLEASDNKVYIVINGTYKNYDDVSALQADVLKSVVASNADSWADTTITNTQFVTDADAGTFRIRADVTELPFGQYLMKLNGNDLFHESETDPIVIGNKSYSYQNRNFGGWSRYVLTIVDISVPSYDRDLNSATLRVDGNKVYMIIAGKYQNYSEEDLRALVIPTSAIDAEKATNGSGVIDLMSKVRFTYNVDGTYEIAVEITELEAAKWWMHFGPKSDGSKVDVRNTNGTDAVICGGKSYQFLVEPQTGWTAYRLNVVEVAKITAQTVALKEKDGKPIMIVTGAVENWYEGASVYLATTSAASSWQDVRCELSVVWGELDAKGTKTFTAEWDMSVLVDGNNYYLHFGVGKSNGDLPSSAVLSEEPIEVGGSIYRLEKKGNANNSPLIYRDVALDPDAVASVALASLPADLDDVDNFEGLTLEVTKNSGDVEIVNAAALIEANAITVNDGVVTLTYTYGDDGRFVYVYNTPSKQPEDITVMEIGKQEWNNPVQKDFLTADSWDTNNNVDGAGKSGLPTAGDGTLTFTDTTWSRLDMFTVKHVQDGQDKYNNIGAEVQGRVDGQEFGYTFFVNATNSSDANAKFSLGLLLANGFKGDMSGGTNNRGIVLDFDGNMLFVRSAEGGAANVLCEAVTNFTDGAANRIDFSFTRVAHKITLRLWINGVRVLFNDVDMSKMARGSIDADHNFCFLAGASEGDGDTGYSNYGNRLGVYAGDGTTLIIAQEEAKLTA